MGGPGIRPLHSDWWAGCMDMVLTPTLTLNLSNIYYRSETTNHPGEQGKENITPLSASKKQEAHKKKKNSTRKDNASQLMQEKSFTY